MIRGYVCGSMHIHVYVGSMGFDVVKEEEHHMILRSEDKNDEKCGVPDISFSKSNVQLQILLRGELTSL